MATGSNITLIEGVLTNTLIYHFDLNSDVLYLRLASTRHLQTVGEETADRFILLRTAEGNIAGMTIISFWKRFGKGSLLGATLDAVQHRVEETAQQHPMAA